jgi:hypothetical protein
MMAGVIQSHLYSTMKGEKKKRQARGNMGSKNEAEKNPQRIFNLTRLSGTSGSHERCDILLLKTLFPESRYYKHAGSLHILLH